MATSSASSPCHSPLAADTRVEDGVQYVDREIDQHEDRGDEEHTTLYRAEVAGVHGEYFAAIRPANTIMQVSRFIDPDWLLEIEVDAVVWD